MSPLASPTIAIFEIDNRIDNKANVMRTLKCLLCIFVEVLEFTLSKTLIHPYRKRELERNITNAYGAVQLCEESWTGLAMNMIFVLLFSLKLSYLPYIAINWFSK
uniref:Uncharacterized protein n=1 Tax=Glossina pallidipes TaxID=7398 RepID=A0A1A9ZMC6_GLOPL